MDFVLDPQSCAIPRDLGLLEDCTSKAYQDQRDPQATYVELIVPNAETVAQTTNKQNTTMGPDLFS